MAELLRALVPARVEVKREVEVDSLTPTQIADAYMKSKVNSIRTALLRGYEVDAEEVQLHHDLLESNRSEAHRLFIQYYSERDYLPLNALNRTYPLVGGDRVIGDQPPFLTFVFYSSDGPYEEDVDINEGAEIVLIGLTPIVSSIVTSLQAEASKYNATLKGRLAIEMATWPLDNPFAPYAVLHKKGAGLDDMAEARGVSAPQRLESILSDDALGRCYGVEPGDYLVETVLAVDPAAIAKRKCTVRYCPK